MSRIPACSPAATRLQNRASKYKGYLRNACARLLPVSTSVFMSRSNRVTDGLLCPLATISNDCNNGTPAFIMVASCREKSVMSCSVIFFPPRFDCFFTFGFVMPCRRNVAFTMFSPDARISPFTSFPDLSLPSQEKLMSLASLPSLLPVAVAAIATP